MPRLGDEVVTLDGSDTIRSLLAKLEESVGDVAVLVISSDCHIADGPLVYRLLARASQRYAAPFAVISSNPAWRQLAREHGLRAFPSIGALRRAGRRSALSATEEWADSLFSTINPWALVQVWPVAAVVVVIMAAVLFFVVPVMTITLRAPTESISQTFTVNVDESKSSIDDTSMTIPGRTIEDRFTITDFIDTTGEKKVGKDPARGEVTILNSAATPITIPSGTTLTSSSGVKFTTTTAVTVGGYLPAGPVATPTGTSGVTGASGLEVGGAAVKVPIVAVDPGEKGNVPALAISMIDGDLFQGLTVLNEQPTSGGTDTTVRTASADDRAKLKESLLQKAQTQSLSEVTARLGPLESLVPTSVQVKIEGEEYDKAVDEVGNRLTGTVYVSASAMAFANKDLNSVVESQWKKSTPKRYEPLPGNLALSAPQLQKVGPRTATLTVKATGQVVPVVKVDNLAQSLRGSSVSDARSKLGNIGSGFSVQGIKIWPRWAPRAYRIEVHTIQ